ncbi:NAD(P)-binding protein [Panus rudis PR-1116 ss-1]|nr:NAD(P)-binding protein [Panus rudis PR-1116 ss-1]
MPSYLITGSSRGIGLALAAALLKDPSNVVLATARNPSSSEGLQDLAKRYPQERLTFISLDINVPEQIERAAREADKLLPHGLDYLINNAGVNLQVLVPFDEIDMDLFTEEVKSHTTPIMNILRTFKPLVARSTHKKVVFISSDFGSISLATDRAGVAIPYSVGKAAQNMIARKWGLVNKEQGITTVVIHPGWVDTDMGNTVTDYVTKNMPHVGKAISREECVAGIMKVIHQAKLEDAVQYLWYDGRELTW